MSSFGEHFPFSMEALMAQTHPDTMGMAAAGQAAALAAAAVGGAAMPPALHGSMNGGSSSAKGTLMQQLQALVVPVPLRFALVGEAAGGTSGGGERISLEALSASPGRDTEAGLRSHSLYQELAAALRETRADRSTGRRPGESGTDTTEMSLSIWQQKLSQLDRNLKREGLHPTDDKAVVSVAAVGPFSKDEELACKYRKTLTSISSTYHNLLADYWKQYSSFMSYVASMLRHQATVLPCSDKDMDKTLSVVHTRLLPPLAEIKQLCLESIGEARKQMLSEHVGRKRRTNFSKDALKILNDFFFANINNPYPTEEVKEGLACQCGITVLQISNWFGNKRIRFKKNVTNGRRAAAGHRLPGNAASASDGDTTDEDEEECWGDGAASMEAMNSASDAEELTSDCSRDEDDDGDDVTTAQPDVFRPEQGHGVAGRRASQAAIASRGAVSRAGSKTGARSGTTAPRSGTSEGQRPAACRAASPAKPAQRKRKHASSSSAAPHSEQDQGGSDPLTLSPSKRRSSERLRSTDSPTPFSSQGRLPRRQARKNTSAS